MALQHNVNISGHVDDNHDALLQEWNTHLANLFIPLDVFFGLTICLGFFGNLVVFVVYRFCMAGKINDRYFIPLLAIMDGLVCLTGPLISLILSIRPVTFYGDAICKSSIFVFRLVLNCSVLLMLVIAVQRFRKVCRPFGRKMDMRLCKIATCITITIATFMAFPNVIFFGEIRVHGTFRNTNLTGYRCGLRLDHSDVMKNVIFYYQILCFVIIVIIVVAMIVMYSCVGQKIYLQTKRIEHARASGSSMTMSGTDSDSQNASSGNGVQQVHDEGKKKPKLLHMPSGSVKSRDSVRSVGFRIASSAPTTPTSPTGSMAQPTFKRKRARSVSRRYTLLFMAISIFFVVAYIPTLMVNIVSKELWDSSSFWINYSDGEKKLYTYLFFTYVINHIANPFFYGFFDSSFRREILKYLRCRCMDYRFEK